MALDVNGIFVAASGVATAVATFGAWRAASAASRAAAKTAEIAEAAERDRRWTALTPQFRFETDGSGPGYRRGRLRIFFDGPLGLDRLDIVSVTIRDDRPDRGRQTIAGGPSREKIRLFVWSPYKLNTNIENVDQFGRTVTFPDGLAVGEEIVCALEKTNAPSWVTAPSDQWWQEEYANKPIRLLITCEKAGLPTWRIPIEVDAPVDPLTTVH